MEHNVIVIDVKWGYESVQNKREGKHHRNVQTAPTYIECMIHVRLCKNIERNATYATMKLLNTTS